MSEKNNFGLRLKWLGCACFEMDFGNVTVVNDPWITPNAKTELTWEAVEKCDYITLTHGHYDHTLDIPALVERFDPYILCGENTALPLMRWADLSPMKVYPMYHDMELDLEDVKIKALSGRHTPLPGNESERKINREKSPVNAGDPNLIELSFWGDFEYRNFLFTTPDGVKIFIWGNTLDRPDQRAILRQLKPDIAILQITGRNPIDKVVDICKDMECKVLIPNHIDFPKDYTAIATELGEEMAKNAPEIRFIYPEYGKWIEL
ncbi:MAG: MBL fold metallo-hydrolase [Clostridia bacterium]|nr:MBL fold metallo-hydrolase [Clostridia bacterium]